MTDEEVTWKRVQRKPWKPEHIGDVLIGRYLGLRTLEVAVGDPAATARSVR